MRRRNFIKNITAGGAAFSFQGIPIKLVSKSMPLHQLAANADNDRVLIILQMHGGNDGLNTFIPLDRYDEYYSRRANIAIPYRSGSRTVIPLDSTVASEKFIGVHPDMRDFKEMYDQGSAAVVQGVSYQNNNGSHFRGRDIWFMGGSSEDYYPSGWIGRYLTNLYQPLTYPEHFPNDDMPDPLALEMGNDVSLLFHQDAGIPLSISLGSSPESLANLIEQLEGFSDEGVDPRGLPPEFMSGSPYGKEMDWILGLEDKSEIYIKRLQQLYQAANESSITYPEKYPYGDSTNPLSRQLQLVARLLEGGVKTKVFLVKIGGFDTHAQQVEDYNPTLGGHAALLHHITSAMRAFQSDLKARGIDDRVMTVTMSEFGRRIFSNGSFGTDHGVGGPVMAFGKYVNPGIFGNNPDTSSSNVGMEYDYRELYGSLLYDWMGVSEEVINNDIFFGSHVNSTDPDRLKIANTEKTVLGNTFYSDRYNFKRMYPNPAKEMTTLKVMVNDTQTVKIAIRDIQGRLIREEERIIQPGLNSLELLLNNLKPATYFVQVKSNKLDQTKKLIIKQ
ncbi:MAG: DUF1501 domain-containing protein [Cyclobacteriaceae bacterium]